MKRKIRVKMKSTVISSSSLLKYFSNPFLKRNIFFLAISVSLHDQALPTLYAYMHVQSTWYILLRPHRWSRQRRAYFVTFFLSYVHLYYNYDNMFSFSSFCHTHCGSSKNGLNLFLQVANTHSNHLSRSTTQPPHKQVWSTTSIINSYPVLKTKKVFFHLDRDITQRNIIHKNNTLRLLSSICIFPFVRHYLCTFAFQMHILMLPAFLYVL